MLYKRKLYTVVSSLLLVTMLANTVLLGPATIKASFNPVDPPSSEVILVLVDTELLKDNESYSGLSDQFSGNGLSDSNLERRINRYVDDIKDRTTAKEIRVVQVEEDTDPAEIAATLKSIYYADNLQGLIIFGDVPLPVVNKSGNRFISLYPYTDFEDAAYVFNPENHFFERNSLVQDFEPEIWHGLIRFNKPEQYAAYLDKNHLYYSQAEGFADFEEKIFYLNPDMEANSLNSSLLGNYDNFNKCASESVYNRYSNKLLAKLSDKFTSELDNPLADSNNPNLVDQLGQIPDIQTNLMIDKYMNPVTSLFESALGDERKALLGTGRYNSDDYYTPINLIANKDEYYKQYFWQLAILIEDEIDRIVEREQRNITIINGAELAGTIYLKSGDELEIPSQFFVNNSYQYDLTNSGGAGVGKRDTISKYHLKLSTNFDVNSADDCRLFQGGALGGDLSKTIERWRRNFVAEPGGDNSEAICLKEVINKHAARKNEISDDSYMCSQFYGRNIRDNAHSKLANLDYKGQVTHEACFSMRPLDLFQDLREGHSRSGTKYKITNVSNSDFTKAEARVSSEKIILADIGQKVTLADVLKSLPTYHSDPKDWNAWSSYLLANPVQRSFIANQPYGEDHAIEKIVLNVSPIHSDNGGEPSFSSVITHKDPTPEIIKKAVEDNELLQLPIDEVRYTTFVDKKGDKQEIVYPNLFKTSSLQDLIQKLNKIEENLSGISGQDYSSQLTSLIHEDEEVLSEDGNLETATKKTLENLFAWRSLSLDQKYTDILKSVLDLDQEAYVPNLPKNYEIALIDSRADQNSLLYALISDETFGLSAEDLAGGQDLEFMSEMDLQNEKDKAAEKEERTRLITSYPLEEWVTEYLPNWYREVESVAGQAFPPDVGGILKLPGYDDVVISSETDLSNIVLTSDYKNISLESEEISSFKLELKNFLGQTIVGEPITVDLTVDSDTEFQEGTDDDNEKPGIQIFVTSGQETIYYTPLAAGDVIFTARAHDLSESLTMTVYESLATRVSMVTNQIQAGQRDGLKFKIKTVSSSGNSVSVPAPKLSLNNPGLGSFSVVTEDLVADEFEYIFRPGNLAGTINLSIDGFASTPLVQEIKILPDEAKKLKFVASDITMNTQEPEIVDLELQVLDKYGNLVKNANHDLDISLSNPEKVILKTPDLNLIKGKAKIQLESKPGTFGTTFLKVEVDGLVTAIAKVSLGSKLTTNELKTLPLSSLYLELQLPIAGIDDLGQKLLSQGKSQVISTLSTDLESSAPIFYLHPNGAVEVINDQVVQTTLTFAPSETQLKVYDTSQRELATVKINTEGLSYKGFLGTDLEASTAGIYLESTGDLNEEDLLEIVKIKEDGLINLSNGSYSFESYSNANHFTLSVIKAKQEIARIVYVFSLSNAVKLSPALHPDIQYTEAYTLASSNQAQGFKFFKPNEPLSSNQLPLSKDTRLENNIEQGVDLLSLRDGHKAVMLLSAGENAGEANRPYLSEAGVVLGDPLIALSQTENISVENHYGYDIGEYLGRTDTPVSAVLERDDYIVLAEENGTLSRLYKKSKRLDKNFAKIPSGIKEIVDYQDSFLILTKEECVKDDSCVYRLYNNGVLESVPLETDGKILKIFTSDFTGDGDLDLAVLSNQKKIYLFLQTDEGLDTRGSVVASTNGSLEPNQNLAASLWIQTQITHNKKLSDYSLQLTLDSDQTFPFIALNGPTDWSGFSNEDSRPISAWQESSFVARDINGGGLKSGDILEYTLFLKNTGPPVRDAFLSLPVNQNYKFVENSLTSPYTLNRSTDALRPYLIGGINLDTNSSLQLKIQFKYTVSGQESPAIINIVTDEEGYPSDGLPDFRINIPNADFTTYYYSEYDTDQNRLNYIKLEKSLGASKVDGEGVGEILENANESQQQSIGESLSAGLKQDSDGDGIPDFADSNVASIESVGDSVEDFIKGATCENTGCLAIPHNRAFLVPNNSPGTPVVGWGCPSLIGVNFGRLANSCVGGRFYLSPTLTGELAGSVCLGVLAPGIPNCFTARIGNLGGMCDTINNGIQEVLGAATEVTESLEGPGIISITGEEPSESGVNIQVPGFPATITNWVTAQLDEIQRNALDLPNLTLIYPDLFDLIEVAPEAEGVGFNDIESVLTSLNAMPLFNISTETHYLKYPQIEPGELGKYNLQLSSIWEANLQEFNRALQSWGCYGDKMVTDGEFVHNLKSGDLKLAASASNECISLSVKALDIKASFDYSIENLKLYRELPKDIFEAEIFLAKYANSIIAYADVILDNTAAYISTNRAILLAWQNMFQDINELVEGFQVILDVFITYQDSCSSCRNSGSEDGWVSLMSALGSIIPAPPVVAIPKMPNFTLDVSQIQASIDIVLPKFEFKPEKVALPDLTGFSAGAGLNGDVATGFQIKLPDAPPINFTAEMPSFNLNLFPSIPPPPDLKKYLITLPDLPEIQIPELPTLPAPPEINIESIGDGFMEDLELGLGVIDKVLRIICLIKKGIVPLNEFSIKGQIESLTARPLNVVLPIDLQAGFSTPNTDVTYLKEYKVNVETNIDINFDQINEFAEGVTKQYNKFESKITGKFSDRVQTGVDNVNEGFEGLTDLTSYNQKTQEALENFAEGFANLDRKFAKLETELPETINLVATTKTIPQPDYNGINLDRGFALPPEFERQIKTLVAYSEHPISFNDSSVVLADNTNTPKFSKTHSIQTKTYKLAASGSGGSNTSDLEFNVNTGMYVYNKETGRTENILAYKAESKKTRQMLGTDLDKDGDSDILYTRDREIFFKANLENEANDLRRASVKKLQFDEININNTSNIEYSGTQVSLGYKTVSLSLEGLSNQTIVIDIFQSSFTDLLPVQRFVLEDSESAKDFINLDKVSLSDDYVLKKESFQTINYRQSSKKSLDLNLDNQAYIASIYVFNRDENTLETIESRIAFTPNVCGDKVGPEIVVEQGTDIEVAVTNPIDVDLSGSTDYQSEIAEVYLDINLENDTDGDGDPINDRDLQGSGDNKSNSSFRLSPINETKDFQVAAWIIDVAGNSSYQIITIHVLAPKIILDELDTSLVTGYLEPYDDNVPLSLIRQRQGLLQEIDSAKTDEFGQVRFEDLIQSDSLLIYNKANEVLFKINKKTGSLKTMTSSANYKLNSAIAGISPTLIKLYEDDKEVSVILRSTDSNFDVNIIENKPSLSDILASQGVTVVTEASLGSYDLIQIPGDDLSFAGGAAILKDGQRQAIINTDGSLIMINSDFTLDIEQVDDTTKAQWFQIKESNKVLASIFISPGQKELEIGLSDLSQNETIINNESEGGEVVENSANSGLGTGATNQEDEELEGQDLSPHTDSQVSGPQATFQFEDIRADDPDREIFNYLASLGVINGVERNGKRYFEPDRMLSRAEYAKIILKIMCIEPSDQAYLKPAVFNDIPFQHNLAWYYPETKETKLQGLFEGYKGETN